MAKSARRVSVVAPCYNEEENIPALIERTLSTFAKMGIPGELVLVDDGSKDRTKALIEAGAAVHTPSVKGVFLDRNKGMEEAWKAGIDACSADVISLIDADLQYLPEDISRLYASYIRNGVDLVQGWRTSINRERDSRYILSRGLNVLLNMLFSMSAHDSKSGFVLARKGVLQDVLSHRMRYSYFQTFITVAARAHGYSIAEVEVLFDRRRGGTSFLSGFPLRVVLLSLFDLAKGFIEYRFMPRHALFLERFLERHPVTESGAKPSLLRRVYFKLYIALMPLHHWVISSRAGAYVSLLRKTQWLSPESVEQLQMERLRALLEHAYRHVPYWRELFDSIGFMPEDARSLSDLQRLPLLEKQVVRERVHFDLLADNVRRSEIIRIATSGSTGQPLVCYADRTQLELRWAATLRSQEWTGYRFGDRCVRLWHQTIGMSWSQILREHVDALFSRRTFIPAYQIGEHNIRGFLRTIERARPVLIDGYAESFNFLSTYMQREHLTTARPKGIMSSAQMLPKQSRKAIEAAFHSKVYDKYGSREFSGIAYECGEEEGMHHVVAESYIVEIIKDGRPALPGEMGEIVITDLNNYAMPFIRYRVGDLARAAQGSCACGRGLPRIGEIEGRTQSIILGTNGSFVPGTFFAHYFKEYDYALNQYQIEQSERGAVTLRLVRTSRFNDSVLEEILAGLKKYLGEDMRFAIEYVDVIPLSRTGKVQVSISKLDLDFQSIQHHDV